MKAWSGISVRTVGMFSEGPESGKEKAHRHKQIFPVTARAGGGLPTGWGGGLPTGWGGGSPDWWPGVKSLCAVCGTQGT